jgi:hypothetical protein
LHAWAQRKKAEVGRNLLGLIFSNFDEIDIKNTESGMVTPDYYHPSLVTDVLLATCRLLHNKGPSYMKYSCGDY